MRCLTIPLGIVSWPATTFKCSKSRVGPGGGLPASKLCIYDPLFLFTDHIRGVRESWLSRCRRLGSSFSPVRAPGAAWWDQLRPRPVPADLDSFGAAPVRRRPPNERCMARHGERSSSQGCLVWCGRRQPPPLAGPTRPAAGREAG